MTSARASGSALVAVLALVLGGCASPSPAPMAARWEKEVRAFEAADRTNPPPAGATLFVGSSSIRLWTNLVQEFPGRPVLNRGFGGSQMSDLVALADRLVLPYEPRFVLVYEGDNDLADHRSPGEVAAGFREFARRVHRRLPRAHVAFIAIKPSLKREHLMPRAREANARIASYCETRDWLSFVDVFTPMLDAAGRPRRELFVDDLLHLNGDGYRLWADLVRRHLDRHDPDGRPATGAP